MRRAKIRSDIADLRQGALEYGRTKKYVKGCQRSLKDVKGMLIVRLLRIREVEAREEPYIREEEEENDEEEESREGYPP